MVTDIHAELPALLESVLEALGHDLEAQDHISDAVALQKLKGILD